jgi:hypothetical protein
VDISNILMRRYPGKLWGILDDKYENLEWLDESPKPTKKELEKLWPEVKREMEIESAQAMRRIAYAQKSDGLFFKYQAGEVTEEEWRSARQEVKDKYPY